MPPFTAAAAATTTTTTTTSPPSIITLNIGGRLFQTTSQTLSSAGASSLLSSPPPFIDRDPDLFSPLLALLRTGRLPSAASADQISDLAAEAEFYGIDPRLLFPPSSSSSSSSLSLKRSLLLPLPGRDAVAALSASNSGEILAAHGSKISSFDFSLRRRRTLLTALPAVDSLLGLPGSSLAFAGAADFPGLQVLDLGSGDLRKSLNWHPHASAPGATVQAVCAAVDRRLLFTSFESGRRNASAVVAFDLGSGGDFRPVFEICRREIYGAELDSGIPATKVEWVPSRNLLVTAGSHWGPSGVVGNIQLWDVRAGGGGGSAAVFDLKEKDDCFADVAVSDGMSAMFKVGANSGDVFMADLRKLDAGEPWFRIGGGTRNGGKNEGKGCRIESEGRQVFCSRGGDIEMWSEVAMAPEFEEKVMRRNLMGREKDMGGARILQMVFGGKMMAVARSGECSVEVWERSDRC